MTEKKSSKFSFQYLPREVQISIQAAQDKKSEDLTVLDLRRLTSFTDYFIITHGRSSRQNAAITDHIEAELKKENIRPLHIEGRERGEWILMDYGFFIVHIFSSQARDYYSLEKLWRDAARMNC
ncbi:MAG: ribosome silencing factor [Candidatus Aminicenantes bacterium]|nr:ribosome silencing factor [Candidatus Aminicenantes bacterium]